MITGTHNTMSYLRPAAWWMRPFRPWAQCQTLDIRAQLYHRARYFDLRIRIDQRTGDPYFCHGLIAYKAPTTRGTLAIDANPTLVIQMLSRHAALRRQHIYLRIMLETLKPDDRPQQTLFRAYIDTLRRTGSLRETGFLHLRIMEKEGFIMLEDHFPTYIPSDGTPIDIPGKGMDTPQGDTPPRDCKTRVRNEETAEMTSETHLPLQFIEVAPHIDTWWKFLLTPRFFVRAGRKRLRQLADNNYTGIAAQDFL